MAIDANERIGPYMCSVHSAWMVPKTAQYTNRYGVRVRLEYYGCPMSGCSQAKPNKRQLKPVTRMPYRDESKL